MSGGSYVGKNNGTPISGDDSPYDELGTSCSDFVGRPIADSDLSITHFDKSKIGRITGQLNNSTYPTWIVYDNFPCERFAYDYTGFPGSDLVDPSAATLATTVLARTNPSRPDYSLGSLAQNIYETPALFKYAGDLLRRRLKEGLAKNGADAYLATKFGLVPFIQDTLQVFNVLKYIEARNSELKRLYGSSAGLRRRLQLGNYSGSGETTEFVDSGVLGSLTCRRRTHVKMHAWGTVSWHPTSSPESYPTDSQRLASAYDTSVGLTASGAFVSSWDLIPWTWMLGWCTNVRDYVLAHGNTIPCQHGNVNIMKSYTATSEFKRVSGSSWHTGGDGSIDYWRKTRSVVSKPALSAYLPHLDGGRLSVLAALGIQRKAWIANLL